VVSVSNPEIDKFGEIVRIARGRDDFLAKIEDALANDTPAAALARIASVAGETWDARVETVLARVATALTAKTATSGR
jgi:hypothetical protein